MKTKQNIISAIIIILCLTILSSFFVACSKSSGLNHYPNEGGATTDGSGLIMPSGENRKIIYDVYAAIETDNFSNTLKAIENAIVEINTDCEDKSYVSKSEIDNATSYAEIVLKVNTDKLAVFLNKFSDFGRVVNRHISSEDITEKYADTAAIIAAYNAELQLLQEKLEKENNTDVAFRYTTRITQINKEINYYQSLLNSYDSVVDFSTVTLRIYSKGEVPIEEKYDKKIEKVFFGSLNFLLEILKFLFLALIAIWPYALIALAVFLLIKYIRKYLKKKHKSQSGVQKDLNEHSQDTFR